MKMRLEHANICVSDIEAMITFLQTAFPDFRVRGEGTSAKNGLRWLHIGTNDSYIALQEAKPDAKHQWAPYSGIPGVNHLAYEVDDVDALLDRLETAGYNESTPANSHPFRKRVYFYDPEGNDWEFVQYYSEIVSERNDYELPNA